MTGWFHNLLGRIATRYSKTTLGNPATLDYWVRKFWGRGDGKTLSGIEVNEDTALSYGAYYRAVNILSGAVGFLPLKVYRRLDRGKEEDAQSHEQFLLQYRANPYMDSRTLRKALQAHAITWGNGYAEIERDGSGRARNLWLLLPDRTEPKLIGKGADARLVYETHNDGQAITLEADDVIHIAGLGFDGLKGYSLIQYAAESIGLGLAAEQYSAAFFGNESVPVGAITTEQAMDKKTVEATKEAWERNHQAMEKKHSIAVLHGGMKWQSIGIPAKDAQLIESRKLSIADISRWTGVPIHMLSDLSEAHYTNIEHQAIDFVQWSLMDWIKPWEIQLTLKLLDGRGKRFAEFNLDGLLRGDTQARFTAYHAAIMDGWMNRNEVRAKENLNPGPAELDTYLEPLNFVPAGTPRQQAQQQPQEQPSEGDMRHAIDMRWVNGIDLIEQTWERIVTKETKALQTAAGKAERIRDAYDKLAQHIDTVLWPVLRAALGNDAQERLSNSVTEYVQAHRAAASNGHDVLDLCSSWMNDEPGRMARLCVKGYYDGRGVG